MNRKTVLTLILIALTLPTLAEEPNSSPIEGQDYSLAVKNETSNPAKLSELEAISNIEIFYWYGCKPCYQVEAALDKYIALHPEISVRRTPVTLRPQWRNQAYIQAIIKQYSAIEEIESIPSNLDIYRQCLSDCTPFKTFESAETWLLKRIDHTDPIVLNQEMIWQTQKNYQKRADLFSIKQLPSIIINETYLVDANQAKTAKRLVAIVDYLLNLE